MCLLTAGYADIAFMRKYRSEVRIKANTEEKREGVLVIVDRYYYHQLNKQDQAVYRAFYDGVMAYQDIIPIPVKDDFPQEAFERIFDAMTKDNPLIYYLNQSACSCASDMFGHFAICPQYFFPKEKVKEYNRKIEKEVNCLAGKLHLTTGTDYEKEIKIHDWFCQNISYDDEGADRSKVVRMIASHNIFGVFAHHRAQCEGIAKAVKVLLNAVDVRCIVVTGESVKNGKSVPHAWNMVNIDGQPYHLDVTWDIGAIGPSFKRIPYDYFNLSDQLIGKEHKVDSQLPSCSSMEHNYFKVNKRTFWMKSQAMAYVEKSLQDGDTELYFRIEGRAVASDVAEKIYDQICVFFSEKGITNKRVKRIANNKMSTYWIKIY